MYARGWRAVEGSILAIALAALVAGTCQPPQPLAPLAGVVEYRAPGLVRLPGGLYDVAAENLIVRRTDLAIDTRLGGYRLGATWNDADGVWRWSFEMHYAGALFVDDTGARHNLAGLAAGDAIPGTWWVWIDAASLKTKGGLVHEFDPAGRLAAVRWASAPYPRVRYVGALVAGVTRTLAVEQCTAVDACTTVFDLSYDAAGRLAAVDDRAGRRAEFSWDAAGQLASARDGLDVARGWPGQRYTYAGGKLASVTNSEGERIEYLRTAGQLVARQIGEGDPEHRIRRLAPVGSHLQTELVDALGQRTRYLFDRQRRVREVERESVGELTRFVWAGRRIVEWHRPDGTLVLRSYAGDDVAAETRPSGNQLVYQYAPDAVDRGAPLRRPLARLDDSLGLVERRAYDASGRLVEVANGADEVTRFSYAADESIATRTTPAGVVTSFSQLGEHGHPTHISVNGNTRQRVYDGVGNLLELGDGEVDLGGVTARSYDEDRNVVGLVLAGQRTFEQLPAETLVLEHRSDGQVERILRPGGADVEHVRDGLGRVVESRERSDGAWRTTRFDVDALGRVIAVEKPNGMREERDLDALGRLVERRLGRGAPLQLETSAHVSWQDGRVVRVDHDADPDPEALFYDVAGRIATVQYPDGEILSLAWDARDRLVAAVPADPATGFARSLGFGYDGADREVAVVDEGTPVVTRSYADGRLVETRSGNGVVRSYGYDPDSGGYRSAVAVDAAGSVIETSDVGPECPPFLGLGGCYQMRTESFGALAALTDELYYLGPDEVYPVAPPSLAGQRISVDHTGSAFDYDAKSNVTARLLGGVPTTFVYDPEGTRLLRIEDDSGGVVHDYVYDEAGYVVRRDGIDLVWDGGGRIAAFGSMASFTWDALDRPRAASVAGIVVHRRFGGLLETDALGLPRALDLGEVRIDLASGTRRYRHLDPRGNVKLETDDAGQVVAHVGYSAYGVDQEWGQVLEGPRFARGREVLDGLVLLGQRLYDPDAARFLAPDPIPQLVNAHAYTLGNPLWYWDPTGFEGTLNGLTAQQWAAGAAFTSAWAAANRNVPVAVGFGLLAASFGVVAAAGGFPWEGDRLSWGGEPSAPDPPVAPDPPPEDFPPVVAPEAEATSGFGPDRGYSLRFTPAEAPPPCYGGLGWDFVEVRWRSFALLAVANGLVGFLALTAGRRNPGRRTQTVRR